MRSTQRRDFVVQSGNKYSSPRKLAYLPGDGPRPSLLPRGSPSCARRPRHLWLHTAASDGREWRVQPDGELLRGGGVSPRSPAAAQRAESARQRDPAHCGCLHAAAGTPVAGDADAGGRVEDALGGGRVGGERSTPLQGGKERCQ